MRRSKFCLGLVAALFAVILAMGVWTAPADQSHARRAADERPAEENKVGEGQLWNLTSKPFVFRFRRRDGISWTEPITIEPGKYLAVRAPQDGQQSELEGITGQGNGHVSVQYPELGGLIRLQLPAQNQSGRMMPFWFAVTDSNGFTRLIQAADVEAAKKRQAELQAEPKLTPQELATTKRMLKANWVLFDR